jgi:hypothetical protein
MVNEESKSSGAPLTFSVRVRLALAARKAIQDNFRRVGRGGPPWIASGLPPCCHKASADIVDNAQSSMVCSPHLGECRNQPRFWLSGQLERKRRASARLWFQWDIQPLLRALRECHGPSRQIGLRLDEIGGCAAEIGGATALALFRQ